MAYNILNSRGDTLTIVREQGIDTSTLDIAIHGRGKFQYGLALNQNQVFQLENFANYTPPSRPMQGQLWLQLTNSPPTGRLRYYDPNNTSADVPQPPDPLAGWVELVDISTVFTLVGEYVKRDSDSMFSDTLPGFVGKTEGVLAFETGGGPNPDFVPGSGQSPFLPGGTQFLFLGEGQGNIDLAPDMRFCGTAGSIASENTMTLIYDGDNSGVHGLSIGKGAYTNPSLTPTANLVAEFSTDKTFNLYNGSAAPYLRFGIGGGNIVSGTDILFEGNGFIASEDSLVISANADLSGGGQIVFHRSSATDPYNAGEQMARFNTTGSFEMLGDGLAGFIGKERGVMRFSGFNGAVPATEDFLYFGEGQGNIGVGPDIRGTRALALTADNDVRIGIKGDGVSTGSRFRVLKDSHVSGSQVGVFSVNEGGQVYEDTDPVTYASLVNADVTGQILPNKQYVDDEISAIPPGMPIGGVIIWPANTAIPTGFQLCNGAGTFSPELTTAIGSTTVPNFTNAILKGSASFSNTLQGAVVLNHRHSVGNQGIITLRSDFPQIFTYAQPSTLNTGFVNSAAVSSFDNLPRHKLVRYIIKYA